MSEVSGAPSIVRADRLVRALGATLLGMFLEADWREVETQS
jgi:hypothetical protein